MMLATLWVRLFYYYSSIRTKLLFKTEVSLLDLYCLISQGRQICTREMRIRKVSMFPLWKFHELNKSSEFRTAAPVLGPSFLTHSLVNFILAINDISGCLLPSSPVCEPYGVPDFDPTLDLRPQGLWIVARDIWTYMNLCDLLPVWAIPITGDLSEVSGQFLGSSRSKRGRDGLSYHQPPYV